MKKFNVKYCAFKLLAMILFLVVSCLALSAILTLTENAYGHLYFSPENRVKLQPFEGVNVEYEIEKLDKCKPIGFWEEKRVADATMTYDEKINAKCSIINSDYYKFNKVKLSAGNAIENYRPQKGSVIEALACGEKVKVGDTLEVAFRERIYNIKTHENEELSRITFDVVIVGLLDSTYLGKDVRGMTIFIPEIADILDYKKYVNGSDGYTLHYDSAANIEETKTEFRSIGYIYNNHNEIVADRMIAPNGYVVMISLVLTAFVLLFNFYNIKKTWNCFFENYEGALSVSKKTAITTVAIDVICIGLCFVIPMLFFAMDKTKVALLLLLLDILTALAVYATIFIKLWKTKKVDKVVDEKAS